MEDRRAAAEGAAAELKRSGGTSRGEAEEGGGECCGESEACRGGSGGGEEGVGGAGGEEGAGWLVQKYKNWRSCWNKSTNTDAAAGAKVQVLTQLEGAGGGRGEKMCRGTLYARYGRGCY